MYFDPRNHPERRFGEVFLSNINSSSWDLIRRKSKRQGIVAYGDDGKVTDDYFPIFCRGEEFLDDGIDLSRLIPRPTPLSFNLETDSANHISSCISHVLFQHFLGMITEFNHFLNVEVIATIRLANNQYAFGEFQMVPRLDVNDTKKLLDVGYTFKNASINIHSPHIEFLQDMDVFSLATVLEFLQTKIK